MDFLLLLIEVKAPTLCPAHCATLSHCGRKSGNSGAEPGKVEVESGKQTLDHFSLTSKLFAA